MTNTIKALWNGSIEPCEQCGENEPEIKDLIALIKRNRDALWKATTPQQQEIFEKYIDCSDEYLLRLTEQAFCQGFCLASKLMAEALSQDYPLYP